MTPLDVDRQVLEAVVAHARFCLPAEACGLLALDPTGRVRMVYALTNVDDSPVSFTLDPVEHHGAWRHARAHGWDIGGAFHSHPRGDARPSPRDLRELPSWWLHLIVGWAATTPRVRAWRIESSGPVELALRG